MENSEFELLQQRDIINTMIDGKFLPYLSANNIKDLGMQFGYNLKKMKEPVSRWKLMEKFLIDLHIDNRTNELLNYLVSPVFLKDEIREKNSINFSQINVDSQKQIIINQKRNEIIETILKHFNEQLIFSNKKMFFNNEIFSISDASSAPKVIEHKDRIDNAYITSLVDKGQNDLLDKDFDSVITKARTLLEAIFLQIIFDHQQEIKQNGNIMQYRNKVHEILGMSKTKDWNPNVTKMVGSLNTLVSTISELRNNNSDAHASTTRMKINEAEAELILNSSVMIGIYYLKVSDRHK